MRRHAYKKVLSRSAVDRWRRRRRPARTAQRRSLRIEVQQLGDRAIVRLFGSADALEADGIRKWLEKLAAQDAAVIVLDLGGLDFVGSAGLAAIISGHLETRQHDGRIRLVAPQPCVRDVLERTRLTRLFPIYASVERALSA